MKKVKLSDELRSEYKREELGTGIRGKYFDDYRRLTKEEIGHTGPWHSVFLVAMALSLVFVIIGLIIK